MILHPFVWKKKGRVGGGIISAFFYDGDDDIEFDVEFIGKKLPIITV